MTEKKACIVMVPCPGQGHMIPIMEFAKRLLLQHPHFHVTFLIPTIGPPTPSMKAMLNTLPPNIDSTILTPVNMEDLPQYTHPATQMKLTVKLSLPSLHQALTSLLSSSTTHKHNNIVALVFDLFSSDVLDVAKQFNLPSYVFFSSGAATLSFSFCMPKLDQSVSSDYLDLAETVNVPGCVTPFQIKDLPDLIQYARSSENYKSYLSALQKLQLVDGVIVNTFIDLELESITALLQGEEEETNNNTTPCVYPIGPIIQMESRIDGVNKLECITWLNNQPLNSVLYVSFGSGGTLSHDQLNELAFGLELSGHKFLWVVRVPNEFACSAYLVGQGEEDPLMYLPSGFVDRTKGQGFVVPSWAPQIEILAHGSTGGFLFHCGWNSTLESVVHRVPMIAWPLFAEQRMNAKLLNDVLKIAVRPNDVEESGIVKRGEIAKAIKRVMEGDEALQIRTRIKTLSDAAADALGEHGSSTRALSSLAQKWLNI